MKNMLKAAFLLSVLLSSEVMAAACTAGTTFTSKGTTQQDFNKSSAWVGSPACTVSGGPVAGSTVIIAQGTSILVDANTPVIASLTINGTLTLQARTLSLSGNFTNNGTFSAPANSTVALTGGAGVTQTITGNATFGNLTVAPGTQIQLAGNITIMGTLTGLTAANLVSTCPTNYTITDALGTVLNSCPTAPPPGNVTMTMSPGSCVNDTGSGSLLGTLLGTIAWAPSPTTNVNLSDTLYATATVNGTTNYLKCTGYNFAIPSTATILGVVVNVQRKSSATSRTTDGAMRLVKAGVIGTVDRSTTTVYTTTDVTEAHGTSADLWGVAWTPADINSPTFGAAFAAKTTRSRTVSVNYMPISVTYSAPPTVPHHIQIEHDGAGLTCAAEQLTVRACADAACTTNFSLAQVTGNVTWAGTPGGTIPFTIAAGGTGQTTVSLPVATAQTVTLGTGAITPTPMAASGCTNLSGGAACSLTFAASTQCRDAVEVGAAAGTPIFTKLAGTPFSLDVLSVGGAKYTGKVQVELVDTTTGSCATYSQLNTQNVQFNNANAMTVAFNYPNAVKAAKIRMTGTAASSCSTDGFTIRPVSLAVTSTASADATGINASATPVVKAGAPFTLTATAIPGYNGIPAIDAAKIAAHSGAVAAGLLGGGFAAATAATGVATNNTFTYDEVGYFQFGVNGVKDTTFANLDALKAVPECTPDYSNTLVGGKYGCYFGNSAATPFFGRFVPDHFNTVVLDECTTFTYSRQPFSLEVQAKDAAGGTVQNYQGAYAKPVTLSDALHATALGSFAPAPIPNTMFNMGLAAFDAASVTPVTYTFNNIATGPTTVMVRAVEAAGGDGVSSATPAAPTEGLLNIRSGRLWLGNAYGSEMLNLPVPLQAQYFDGSNFVINPADDVANTCTTVTLPTLTLLPSGTPVGATLNSSLLAGNGGLVLNAPHVAGTVDMIFVAPAWLQYNWTGAGVGNPSARATFGVFGGGSNNVFIYRGRRGR